MYQPSALQVGIGALIVGIGALAQRLGGWEHKPTARVLLFVCGGLTIWWGFLFLPFVAAWMLLGLLLGVLAIWFRVRQWKPWGIIAAVIAVLVFAGAPSIWAVSLAWQRFRPHAPKPEVVVTPQGPPPSSIPANKDTAPTKKDTTTVGESGEVAPNKISAKKKGLRGARITDSTGSDGAATKVDAGAIVAGPCSGVQVGNNNKQTVNCGSPEPHITFKPLDKPQPTNAIHPHTTVQIYLDVALNDAKFAVVCDHPCKAVRTGSIPGFNSAEPGAIPGEPNIAAFAIYAPNPFPSFTYYELEVESSDSVPVVVQAVKRLTLTNQQPH